MTFQATELNTAHQAIEHAEATGQNVVRLNGTYFSISDAETDRLLTHGVEFAYIADHNGTIVTIPANA